MSADPIAAERGGLLISCRKCGAFAACVCGFVATAAVAIWGGGKPPPARTAAALASAMTTASTSISAGNLYVADQVTGALRTSLWPGRLTRESIERYAIAAQQPAGCYAFKPETAMQMAAMRAASSGDLYVVPSEPAPSPDEAA
jgi:hypothetical protein